MEKIYITSLISKIISFFINIKQKYTQWYKIIFKNKKMYIKNIKLQNITIDLVDTLYYILNLQDFQLEDTLAITHTLFSYDQQIKGYITKKINEMFISLKRKLINSAKINGAVMCQFFMACGQRFNQLNTAGLFGGQNKIKKKKIQVSPNKIVYQDQSYLINNKQRSPKNNNYLLSYKNKRVPLNQRQQNLNYTPQNVQYLINSSKRIKQSHFQNSNNNEINHNNNFDQIKYNLSFSQQYASYYSPPLQKSNQPVEYSKQQVEKQQEDSSTKYNPYNYFNKNIKNSSNDKKTTSSKSKNLYIQINDFQEDDRNHSNNKKNQKNLSNLEVNNFQDLQNQWKIRSSDNQAPINLVRNSLTFFKQKDKQIDEKLNNCRKNSISGRWTDNSSLKKDRNEGIFVNTNEDSQNYQYPQGWDNFIRTNEKTKKKLMKKHHNNLNEQDQQYQQEERVF